MQDSTAYVMLFLAWAVYFFLHSYLASESFKSFAKMSFKLGDRSQRLLYNGVSTVGLLALLYFNGWIKSYYLLQLSQGLKITSMLLTASGVLILRACFKNYSMSSFLGLKEEEEKLHITGILSLVRHPIYSGTILITLGFFLFDPRLSTMISCSSIFIYLIIGIRLEERKLEKKFGQAYKDYKSQVPMLIPRIDFFKNKG